MDRTIPDRHIVSKANNRKYVALNADLKIRNVKDQIVGRVLLPQGVDEDGKDSRLIVDFFMGLVIALDMKTGKAESWPYQLKDKDGNILPGMFKPGVDYVELE